MDRNNETEKQFRRLLDRFDAALCAELFANDVRLYDQIAHRAAGLAGSAPPVHLPWKHVAERLSHEMARRHISVKGSNDYGHPAFEVEQVEPTGLRVNLRINIEVEDGKIVGVTIDRTPLPDNA